MRNDPRVLLIGIFFALFLGAKSWRRKKIKRAARDLPTRLRRQLGDEPEFAPPEPAPEGLEAYVALHRRSARVMYFVWGLAVLWLAYVAFLLLRGPI